MRTTRSGRRSDQAEQIAFAFAPAVVLRAPTPAVVAPLTAAPGAVGACPARRADAPRLNAAQEPLAIGLPDEAARARLEDRIAAHLTKGRLSLAITDNCYTMIAVKRGRGTYRVRLHHMFLGADPVVVRALARYIADNDRRASGLLGRYIDAHQGHIHREERKAPPPLVIETRGQVHDLQAVFDELNARFFGGAIHARITWGGGRRRRARRHSSIKMGSYSVEDRLIRVHPSLDRPFVPRTFVEWIVYHEMLHQVFAIPVVRGRRQFHTRRFREAEARFPRHAEAARWEKEHLSQLLQY
ncbi:MAG: hypothetical protein HY906_19885 [Deltaproteobacteria bacterium]|nr:hypothetical protein [Deltaproteobacteria bacterium]